MPVNKIIIKIVKYSSYPMKQKKLIEIFVDLLM